MKKNRDICSWHRTLLILLLVSSACSLMLNGAYAASPFVGAWRGRWQDVALAQHGTLQFKVRPNGAFAGTLRNDVSSLRGSWTGSLSDRGVIHADYAYTSGDKVGLGSIKFQAVGTLHRNTDGHLVGRLTFLQGRQEFDVADLDLEPDSATNKPTPSRLAAHSHKKHGKRAIKGQRPTTAQPGPRPTPTPPDTVITHDPGDPASS